MATIRLKPNIFLIAFKQFGWTHFTYATMLFGQFWTFFELFRKKNKERKNNLCLLDLSALPLVEITENVTNCTIKWHTKGIFIDFLATESGREMQYWKRSLFTVLYLSAAFSM